MLHFTKMLLRSYEFLLFVSRLFELYSEEQTCLGNKTDLDKINAANRMFNPCGPLVDEPYSANSASLPEAVEWMIHESLDFEQQDRIWAVL